MTKRILLVDDERSIRESLSKILGAENYEVVLAENGQEAVQKHAAERIDLLILDLNMPVKNGWDTLEWLVGINPLLPVVIITSRSDQRPLAETAGAAALMEKPLDVPLLLKTIRELLTNPMKVPATISGALPDSLEAAASRAGQITSVLGDILHHAPPPSHFGINE